MYNEESFKIKQLGFDKENNRYWESIMSTGNGELGARGNFEESYSGDSLDGRYISGIYFNDRTLVGWWKNGYPDYFAKIVNVPNFFGLDVKIDGTELDLNKVHFSNFVRELDMKNGTLKRTFTYTDDKANAFDIVSERFFSYADPETAVLKYTVKAKKSAAKLTFAPFINADVINETANYKDKFIKFLSSSENEEGSVVNVKTGTTDQLVSTAFTFELSKKASSTSTFHSDDGKLSEVLLDVTLEKGESISLIKYISIVTSLNHKEKDLAPVAFKKAAEAKSQGYDAINTANNKAWSEIWKACDITIDGDEEAQKAIRYNIFQLNCSYSGAKSHLNIGPKGFTGEKYGGGVYWDIEAYCLYFFLGTKNPNVAREILLYRYNQLQKAKENAAKLGLRGALYPMVTVNGEECHNEWEITFEELHRNSAIAFAIKNYTDYTGDETYLRDYGIDVLTEICRFWASRVNKGANGKYMLLGITGPNEYENNVNNNWYTNRMAKWCFEYEKECLEKLKSDAKSYDEIIKRLSITTKELEKFEDIASYMYLPYDDERNVFLQQDGFLDKEIIPTSQLPESDRPLNKNWSWDRILRSCYIKQADVLQGLWFLNDRYDKDTIKRNFDFYEPLTVHESSLSPCIHSILASEIGYTEKAYEMFRRASMLDLHNVNRDTDDGLHITAMAGSWMSVSYGFGGVRIRDGGIEINPTMPKEWKAYSFTMYFRGTVLTFTVKKHIFTVEADGNDVTIFFNGKQYKASGAQLLELNL